MASSGWQGSIRARDAIGLHSLSVTAESVWQWILLLLTSVGAAGGFSWLFKEAVGRSLDREMHRDLEAYKTELSLQFQQQLCLKADLQLRYAIRHRSRTTIPITWPTGEQPMTPTGPLPAAARVAPGDCKVG